MAQAAPRMVRIAVLSGQSNMARGTGPVALTAWPQPWFDNSETTDPDNTAWSGLKLPAEGGVGLHAGVAEALQAAYPDDQIAILKVAQGSTGIGFWADEGQPGNRDLMNRITVARARLDAQLAAGEISGYEFVGFFWMQGEDEINPWNTSSTNPYFQKLIQLTSGVRSRAGVSGLPVVVGRTSSAYAPSTIRTNNGNLRVFPVSTEPGTRPLQADSEFINSDVPRGYALYEGYSDSVRTAQTAWTTYDGRAAWVESDDLPLVDYFHFPDGETGKITLGRRMGRALMRLKSLPVADELLLNAGPHRWVHPGTIRLSAAVTSGPANPASVTWSQLVGNQTATIESPASLSTNVTITEPGTYAFKVTATDGALTHSKTVNVYVRPAGENLPAYGSSPVFYASAPGAPVTLMPDIVNPDSDTLTYTWNLPFSEPVRRFGLGKGIISSTTAANPTVRFTWPGVQILRLQVSDGTTRADGNASGWINVPVFVGTDGPAYPDYSARWSFNQADYLLAEMNTTAPQQANSGVTQSPETPVGGGSGVFNGSAHLQNHIGHWDSAALFLRPLGNFTVAMWVKPQSTSSGVLYEEGGSGQDSALTLRLNAGNLEGAIFQSGALHTVSAPAPAIGEWTHVAFSFDGAAATMRLWINGQTAATTTGLPFSQVSKRSLASAIGARLQGDAFNNSTTAGSTGDFFSGQLDEVRLYERTLDAASIQALYADGVIVTPEGTLSLSASTASVAENAGSVALFVRRTIGSTGAVSVDFTTSDGTAVAGTNYSLTSGTLHWTDGDSANKTITVPVLDNAVYSGNKTFTITLSNPTGALLGSPPAATVTIIENEAVNAAPQISVVTPTGPQTRIATGGAGFFFDTTVTDDGLSGQPVALAWTTVSGPASAVFSSPGAADTTASFPADGTYVVRLTANDGLLTATRDFTIVAGGTPGSGDGPTSGLILRYKFDEGSGTTIGDSAGNHTVTGHANATWTSSGKSGSALDINSTSGRSFSPANQSDLQFNPRADPFTISVWVRTTSTSTYKTIFDKNDGTTTHYKAWTTTVNNIEAFSGGTAKTVSAAGPPALNDGNWHLVTLTNFNRSGTWYFRVYYDNGTAYSEMPSGDKTNAALLRIGSLTSGSNSWSGQLDDFRIYNRSLSASEVGELYAADSTNFAPVVSAASPAPVQAGSPATLDGTVTDDGLPNPPAAVTALWEKVSGPGNVTFGNASAVDTTAAADTAGTYVLRLTASDGAATGAAQVTLTITQPPGYASWAAGIAWGAADSSATADPDGDGLANLLEYALGGSPLMAMDAPAPAVDISGLRVQISFLHARAEMTYTVQGSSDLSAWSDISYPPVPVGQIQTVLDTVDMGAAHPRRFLRLKVSQ